MIQQHSKQTHKSFPIYMSNSVATHTTKTGCSTDFERFYHHQQSFIPLQNTLGKDLQLDLKFLDFFFVKYFLRIKTPSQFFLMTIMFKG